MQDTFYAFIEFSNFYAKMKFHGMFTTCSTPIHTITGIDNVIKSNFYSYPNPFDDIINCNAFVSEIAIININGQVIKSKENTNFIETKELPAGIYLVLLKQTNGEVLNLKMIK